jgi:hypothetical protein
MNVLAGLGAIQIKVTDEDLPRLAATEILEILRLRRHPQQLQCI